MGCSASISEPDFGARSPLLVLVPGLHFSTSVLYISPSCPYSIFKQMRHGCGEPDDPQL